MKQNQRKTINAYSDVTNIFDPFKDDSMQAEATTVGMLKEAVDNLVTEFGADADISCEVEGDEYYSNWTWMIVTTRPETDEELKLRLKREADYQKEERKRAMKIEADEKKLYLKLKKKYEQK